MQLTLVGAGERMSVESESFAAPGAAAVGVVLGDADGTITYLDPTAEGLLGASQAEADGAHWAKVLLGEEDGAGLPIPGELDARACAGGSGVRASIRALPVSYTHLRAHETVLDLVCRLPLEKKKT